MKLSTTPVRGTVDYLPQEMEIRDRAEKIILETYKENGFLHIKTPILENLELLTNGDDGDNQKLMFKTIKRGASLDLKKPDLTEKDIVEEGLRYDLTVPLVRFFSNNKEKLAFPFKAIQIDEAFRAERPQKGRVRQFTQCDIDILGEASPLAEIDLLISGAKAYEKLGFKSLSIKINDRRVLNQIIINSGFEADKITTVCISLDKFDKIGTDGVKCELEQNGFEKENINKLMSIFDKLKSAKSNQESLEVLSSIGVGEEITSSLSQIIETVQKFISPSFNLVYDATIIRGQGYYTGTVYEVYDSEFGRAIGAGGRYDKMVEKFTGTAVPAVGFSIGFYSVIMLMTERENCFAGKKLALIYDKNSSFEDIISAKQKLIEKGFEVSIFAFPKNFNNFAEKLKASGYKCLAKLADIQKIISL